MTALCIALSEGKEEMFELIAASMTDSEKDLYISVSSQEVSVISILFYLIRHKKKTYLIFSGSWSS